MYPFTFKKPRRQPMGEVQEDNTRNSAGNSVAHVDQNAMSSKGNRDNGGTFSHYRTPYTESNSMESDPSYSQFCDGNILNSTHALSEELFRSPIFDAVDTDSDDGAEEEFLLEDELMDAPNVNQEYILPTSGDLQCSSLLTISSSSPIIVDRVWNWEDGKETTIIKEPFIGVNSWTVELDPELTEFDLWQLCFPADILKQIALESNAYAEDDICSVHPDDLSKRQQAYKDITEKDLLRYFAVRIIMGMNKKPEYSQYWTKDPLFHSLIIPKIMSFDRFLQIQKYLHFCDNDSVTSVPDKIYKIRGLWDSVITNMQGLIVPGEKLSVDESLTKFRGRLSFRQFIPSKRNRFGIKTYSVVDQATGFVIKSIIYAGKNDNVPLKHCKKTYGYGGAIVLELCDPYLGKNRTVFCDNYFTSPNLAQTLISKQTYLCGTLRSGRKNAPPVPKLTKGACEALACQEDGKTIMVEYWRDKRIVRMLSTGISHGMINTVSTTGIRRRKPVTVDEYNKNARGIDLADMAIQEYDTGRKTMKWYMKLFFRLLDLTIFNAFTMMKSQKGHFPFMTFRINLVNQLLSVTEVTPATIRHPLAVVDRINAPHYPVKFEKPRRCKVCSSLKKGKCVRSVYGCKECDVGLCVVPCFGMYHKLNKF